MTSISFQRALPLLLVPMLAQAQATTPGALPAKRAPQPTTAAITAGDLMSRLYLFADDSLMGRDVGTEGHVKATEYLAREVKRMGLKPAGENGTFFQTLPLKTRRVDRGSTLSVGGTSLAIGRDWGIGGGESVTVENGRLLYAGVFGDSAASLPAAQLQGRIVAYRLPLNNNAIGASIQSPGVRPAGAAGVLFIVPSQARGLLGFVMQGGTRMADSSAAVDARLFVTDSAAQTLFGKATTDLVPGVESAPFALKATVEMTPVPFAGRNVVAILPGSDPKLRTQYVAVGAHSDHVGMARRPVDHDSTLIFNRIVRPGGAEDSDKMGTPEQFTQVNTELAEWRKTHPPRLDSIYNGADDDGSGSVAVLEVAEFLAAQKVKPKRSTLFVWHAGEEKGLWGSAYFTEHPTVPRDSIVAQLNMDMVGRGAAGDVTGLTKEGKELRGGPDYLQLVGSRRLSTGLGDLVESVNTTGKHGFTFDYAMDANGHPMNIYCRSDHYEYAKWGIPVVFFTTGGHSLYHQLTDEAQYIDYPRLQRVSRLVADLAGKIGNAAARPVVDQPKLDPRGSCKQ